jgi:hypothetical protein
MPFSMLTASVTGKDSEQIIEVGNMYGEPKLQNNEVRGLMESRFFDRKFNK